MPQHTLIIVAHPNLSQSRVNRTWADQLRLHPEHVTVHELYTAYPDGVIDVAAEQRLLERHDRIILQFPFYWFSTPPLLKQWFDQVFTHGWAYGPGGDKLAGKEIGLAVSTGGKAESYAANIPITQLLSPLELTIRYVGARPLPTHTLHGALFDIGDDVIAQNAAAYANHVLAEHPQAVNG